MTAYRRVWLRRIAIALAAMPLLSTSCLDMTIRTVINSVAHSVTPVLDEHLSEQLDELFTADDGD